MTFFSKEYTQILLVYVKIILSIFKRRLFFREVGKKMKLNRQRVREGGFTFWFCCLAPVLMKLRRIPFLVWKEKLEGISDTSFVCERRGRWKCPGRVWLRNAAGKPGAMAPGSSWWLSENCRPHFLAQSPYFIIRSF